MKIFTLIYLLIFTPALFSNASLSKEQALIEAVKDGHTVKIKKLLGSKTNPDATDGYNKTVLMIAASDNNLEAAKLLIEAGAKVNYKNSDNGKTALMFACSYGYEDMSELLIQNKALLDAKDYEGKTAMVYAVLFNRESIIKLLINHKANINARTNADESALSIAIRFGRVPIIESLKTAGAKE